MNIKYRFSTLLVALVFILIAGCKKSWDNHSTINTANINDLTTTIANEPTLSTFYGYLKSTRMDSVLSSSNTYTVWAPSNDALAALNKQSPTYLSDPATLKSFVQYYITNLTYPVSTKGDTLRAQTLNGKYRNVIANTVEEATIVKADIYAKNGILHILNLASPVKANIWAYAHSSLGNANQLNAMNSLDTVTNVAGTLIIKRNINWAPVAQNMNLEIGQFTYFVLQDAAFTQEVQKITPYYFQNAVRPDSTVETQTKTAMLRDVLVKGVYMPNNLPDTLISVGGTKIPIDKSAIVSSYLASNGIVYIVSNLPYRVKDRVRSIRVEGEKWFDMRDTSKRTSYISIRTKKDSVSGQLYSDVEAYNHGVSEFWFDYVIPNANSVTYKVYARAFAGLPGDPQTANFTQRFGVPNPANYSNTNVVFTQVVSGSVNNRARFNEVYLGNYTVAKFGTLNRWRLVSATSTTNNVNTLILDYVRFDPILP